MVASVNTGVPFPGGTVNAPGQEQQSGNTFFDARSTSNLSHKFTVHESPIYLKAFGLSGFGNVAVLMVTETATGEVTEQMTILSTPVALTANDNFLIIDFPGVYRLQIDDSDLGTAIVVGGTTALSYWSWGLAAYGAAIAAGSGDKLVPNE